MQKMPLSFRLTIAIAILLAGCSSQTSQPVATVATPAPAIQPKLTADLSTPIPSPISGYLKVGGSNPDGIEISANSQYLTKGGKPWTPVMGEFHYVRYPRTNGKMKS